MTNSRILKLILFSVLCTVRWNVIDAAKFKGKIRTVSERQKNNNIPNVFSFEQFQ